MDVSAAVAGRILSVAAAVGLAADALFWDARPGASIPFFLALLVAAVVLLARAQGVRPHPRALALLVPVGVLAAGTVLRAEPLTVALDALLAVAGIGALVLSWSTGDWHLLGLRPWLGRLLGLGVDVVTAAPSAAVVVAGSSPGQLKRLAPLLRGLALAAPVVAVVGLLLTSADAVFAASIDGVLGALPTIDAEELAPRGALVTAVAFALAGLAASAARARQALVTGGVRPAGRLGVTEAAVVLATLDLLLASFVAVQVHVLFGGAARVAATTGLTAADYARRGFGELVVVAVLVLVLLLVLGAVTRRPGPVARQVYAGLAAGLVALVVVVLSSAFQRLLLYEDAFGFTRARTYGHVGMVWLGVLLAAVAVAELRARVPRIALGAAVAVVGFAVTLTAVDVDGLVVRRNVERARAGAELDADYLAGLSEDGLVALSAEATRTEGPLRTLVVEAGACAAKRLDADQAIGLREATVPRLRGRAAVAALGDVDPVACTDVRRR